MGAANLNKKLHFNSSDLCIILNIKKNRMLYTGRKKIKCFNDDACRARTELFSRTVERKK